MKDIVVHTIPGSPYGRAVLATLEEKGARYRLAAMTPQGMRSAEHLALHPFGRMPILSLGDFRLYETQAIVRYVDRALPGPALTPAAPEAAARMDQLMNINDWYLFLGGGATIGFQRVVGPRLLGMPTDEAAVAAALPKVQLAIDVIAGELGRKPYLVGDDVTLADLMLAPQLDVLSLTPEWATLAREHDDLRKWLERMNARSSMKRTTWENLAAMAQPLRAAS
jgi:glutathione S-transferase